MTSSDLPTIEAMIEAHPQVEGGAVLLREEAGGTRAVVYVVPRGPLEPDALADEVRRALGRPDASLTVLPVAALPLDASGAVDGEMLATIPVVDDSAIARWEDLLRSVEGVRRAAVVRRSGSDLRRCLHLSDVAPHIRAAEERGRTASACASPGEDRSSKAGAEVVDARAASSDGGPAPSGDGVPRTLLDALIAAAEGPAERGIRYVHRDLTDSFQPYRELRDQAELVLGGLRARGIGPGSRAIFQFRENRDFLTAFWGCVIGGVAPVPVAVAPGFAEPNAASAKLIAAWRMLGQPAVLTTADLVAPLEDFARRNDLDGFDVLAIEDLLDAEPERTWHDCRAEDIAVIMLTSGSTGTPKGVRLAHANLVTLALGARSANGFDEDEISLNWMPLDHVAALLFFHLRDVTLGCRQIQCPTDVVLGDPLCWLDLIDRYRCTVTFAPNFAFGLVNDQAADIQKRAWDLSCMRTVLNGAESIVPRTARRFMVLLEPHGLPATAMVPAWGMSEVSSGVTYSHDFSLDTVRDEDSFVSVGRPIPGVSLRVVDDDDRLVPEGTTGHLQARGATLMAGYFDASLDAEVFTEDGWFRTGDLAFLRDGALTLTGRAKDVIIVNSVNYYSHELEAAVEEVPWVTRSFSAACPVRDEDGDTDRLAVFLHTERGGEVLRELVREVRQACLRKVGIAPDYVLPVARSEIPKTEIGKIQRPLLSKRFAAGHFDDVRRRMDLLLRNERTVPDWFFRKVWRRKQEKPGPAGTLAGTWVVFTDDRGLGDAVVPELIVRGAHCVRVVAGATFERRDPDCWVMDPSDPAHHRRLLDALTGAGHTITGTLHLWSWGEPEPEPEAEDEEGFLRACAPGLFSVLHWIQALESGGADRADVRLLVVSSSSQAVLPGETVLPERAAVLGLVSSAPEELPWLDCRHVDLPGGDLRSAVMPLVAELGLDDADRQIAYRDRQRYVAGLERVVFEGARDVVSPTPGGLYLLTGGLGGLGVEVARMLLERFGARVLLVDRMSVAEAQDDAAPDADRRERLASLTALREAGGDVRHVALDATEVEPLRAAVEDAERAWGRSLTGVFHLAGRYEERALADETMESLVASLRPKLQVARALAPILSERPQAFLVGFSTAITYFGGATVAAYAAANQALEGFLLSRARGASGPTLCLSWSTWRNVGISRAFAGGSAALRAKGYESIGLRDGIASLLGGLRLGEDLVYVGLDGSSPNVRRHLQEEPWSLQGVRAVYTADDPGEVGARLADVVFEDPFGTVVPCGLEWVEELPLDASGAVDRASLGGRGPASRKNGAAKAPETDLERLIADAWSTVLGYELFDVRENFFDLGGSSLLMAQVRSYISSVLQRDISLTEMFQYPTVHSLAAYLQRPEELVSADLVASEAVGLKRRQRLSEARRGGGRK